MWACSVVLRIFRILGLANLGRQAIYHDLQQGSFRLRITVVFLKKDFSRSEEIPNAGPFWDVIHRPFLKECRRKALRRPWQA